MGLSWADLEVGQVFATASRTVTEADIVAFAGLTGDYSEVHVSQQFAEQTQFGSRIAHGLLGLSYSHALMVNPGTFRDCAVAFLGMREWRFAKPILIGDTIRVAYEIAELRSSRKHPELGIMTLEVKVLNQHDEVVQSGLQSLMLSKSVVGYRPDMAEVSE